MTDTAPVADRLRAHGQEHLLRWWDELDESQRARLVADIEAVDFDRLAELQQGSAGEHVDPAAAVAPAGLVTTPGTDAERAERDRAKAVGEELLAAGKVAAVLVAGGQGTRLGYDAPKGTFPVGPLTGASLYEGFAKQLLARSKRAGASIPYLVMTSDATHDDTEAFFREHEWFGLNEDDVHFFRQGTMPACDAESGKLLLAEKQRLATSPDGHGGVLVALERTGLLELCRERGIERLFYHQVDNPLCRVCDPVFLGLHVLRESEMSTKVVPKRTPEEKMGVVVDVDGRTRIIEYSDLPDDVARRRNEAGELDVRAGNIAVHAFDVAFVERLVRGDLATTGLPFHTAHKKVPFVNENGERIEPESPNAHKFERFVFDALPHAKNALVLEIDRRDEFAPVKNAFGTDSPATSLLAATARGRDWLVAAGAKVPDNVPVEIDPLFALDAADVAEKVEKGTVFDAPVLLTE